MAAVNSTIRVTDAYSPIIKNMIRVNNNIISSFRATENASDHAFNIQAMEDARNTLARVEVDFDEVERSILEADNAQKMLNEDIRNGVGATDNLTAGVKRLIGAFGAYVGVRSLIGFVQNALEKFDTKTNMETQLQVVLSNMGATQEAYDSLLETAEKVADKTMYSKTAMVGGAAEIATYLKDTEAVESMMTTLTDYAAGMTGGGQIDPSRMVDYATQLGKVLDGTFDGITKKGFTLTDVQKEIIENGTDMQKALVVQEVINQSWENLAETMAKTPQGTIIQFRKHWDELTETIGGRLYPAVVNLFDRINNNLPQIENAVFGIGNALAFVISILADIVLFASQAYQVFADNWWWIAPIIMGIVGALGAYYIALGTVAVAKGILTVATGIQMAATWLLSEATLAEAMAQWTLNGALYACPIVWIIGLIIALVTIFYAAIAAVNHFAGTSISATGIIVGAFYFMSASIGNAIALVWNLFADVANFIANVFNDPVAAIKILFYDLALTVIGYIQKVAKAIEDLLNNLPWIEVNITSGLDDLYNSLDKASKKAKDESEWIEYVAKMDYQDLGDAYKKGYGKGQGFEQSIRDRFAFESDNSIDFSDLWGKSIDDIEDIADNTGSMADSMEFAEEDLKYMKDIAEREAINRYTTSDIYLTQHNENHIGSNLDLDGVIGYLNDGLEETIAVASEGVHY